MRAHDSYAKSARSIRSMGTTNETTNAPNGNHDAFHGAPSERSSRLWRSATISDNDPTENVLLYLKCEILWGSGWPGSSEDSQSHRYMPTYNYVKRLLLSISHFRAQFVRARGAYRCCAGVNKFQNNNNMSEYLRRMCYNEEIAEEEEAIRHTWAACGCYVFFYQTHQGFHLIWDFNVFSFRLVFDANFEPFIFTIIQIRFVRLREEYVWWITDHACAPHSMARTMPRLRQSDDKGEENH